MIASNLPKTKKSVGRIALNIFALVFTLAPVYLLAQTAWGYVAVTTGAFIAAGDNKTIAEHKVSSNDVKIFREPIVSVTFDDGWRSAATSAAPILAVHNIATTQYIITDKIGQPGYMTIDQLRAMKAAGHEIASHSTSHIPLKSASGQVLDTELKKSKAVLLKNNLIDPKSTHFSFPYGSYSTHAVEVGQSEYATLRNSNGNPADGIDARDVNIKEAFKAGYVIGYGVDVTTKLSDVQAAIAYAKSHNGWLVLIFHQIDDTLNEYSVSPQMFKDILTAIDDAGIKTATINDSYASLEKN